MIEINLSPNTIKDRCSDACNQAYHFMYTNPLIVNASAIAGIALTTISPALAIPALVYSCSAMLSRVVTIILKDPLESFTNDLYLFQKREPYIEYIAFVVATLAMIQFPPLGIGLFCGIGVYRGLTAEKAWVDFEKSNNNHLPPQEFPVDDSFNP